MADVENLITALERRDRISRIYISDIQPYELPTLIAVMNKPYRNLGTFSLMTTSYDFVLPKTFLGGSAPSLRSFSLADIQFPTFPQFILSSNHIVSLSLCRVGYISPEVMAGCLAALPKLKCFIIRLQSPLSHTTEKNGPLTCAVLPALTHFYFYGTNEYFEALVAQIDTPILKRLSLAFSISPLDIPRLHGFVNRIERLGPFGRAEMDVSGGRIEMAFGSPIRFKLAFDCEVQDRKVTLMTQVFSQQLHLLSHVEELEICVPSWEDNDPVIDSSLLLALFRLFIAVQSLYISEKMVATVAVALKGLTVERAMEVFPALCNLYLEGLQSSGSVQELINPFVASRQLSDRPVVIQSWERQLPYNDS